MKNKLLFIFAVFLLLGCSNYEPTEFSNKALEDVFISIDNEEVQFKHILAKHKGKKIVIDIWASWCKDCLESLPGIQKLQEVNVEVVYLYLSLDRDLKSWKEGVDRLKIDGQHYFMQSGWEGSFGKFLGLSWIPRYLVIDEEGEIIVFNETKMTNNLIHRSLKK